MINQLKHEKSPYLKQHEKNPVNWLAWNKETLAIAKKEKKPIFLSVGYASCHWCHVMAHESFENELTAKVMNEKFINIKVDREERPDLDSIFQKSLAILTGAQGGWPLSMFLDENAVPFTGGTYFPPKEIHGRPSFIKVLENVSKVYSENREKIIAQVSQMKAVFKELNRKDAVLKQDYEPFADKIIQYLDTQYGGFKGSPKFPQFYIFETLFYFYNKKNNQKFFKPVENLLINISSRGIYDQLEGGIARYTVDDKWIVPHFEKMLYDNILYVNLLNNFLHKQNSNYLKNKLIQTIKFINSEFLSENNLLGSAYDADSEGVEGKYYTWKYEELENLLKQKFATFQKKYYITKEGNFERSNILVENINNKLNDEEILIIKEAENLLINERKKRVKPFFDDKVQTDLNCYWLYSNLYSSIILDDNELYSKTITKIQLINEKLKTNIFHCYDKNKNEIDVFLEDYVYYALLLISMYELNNDKESLEKCKRIMEDIWNLFFNKDYNLLQKNIFSSNDLFVNPVDIGDNNIPNGNSIYLIICSKLNNITNDQKWFEKLDILTKSINTYISFNFSQMFSFLKALDICEENITVSLHGKINEKLKKEILKKFMGNVSIIYKEKEEDFFVIICRSQTCSKKLKNISQIEEFIKTSL
mgnify:CR=1 FL=1|tara:strand:+ start:16975 stop:18918 length:1944 start_codon:yes stop_codon:yes gene_type:complete